MSHEMHVAATARAEELGMNFSAYVNHLIRADMAKGGHMVISPVIVGANAKVSGNAVVAASVVNSKTIVRSKKTK